MHAVGSVASGSAAATLRQRIFAWLSPVFSMRFRRSFAGMLSISTSKPSTAPSPPRKQEISALAISRSRASSWLPISWNTALSLPVQRASLARLARPQASCLARALTGSLSQSACLGSSMDALRWVS